MRYSTEDVHRENSLAYWAEAVCKNFLHVQVDSPLREHFRAKLNKHQFGPITVNVLEADRQRVLRTRSLIARSDKEMFVLLRMLSGEIQFRQCGREARVKAGESILINASEPYAMDCPWATRAVGLRMPSEWLRTWVPHAERYPAATFIGDRWGGALNASLGCLETAATEQLAVPAGAVAEHVATLLSLALGPESSVAGVAALHERAMRTLRDRLHEAGLNPAAVAAEHQVSQRTLYYAFSAHRTTFMEALLELRLNRALTLLEDRRLISVSIADIAAQCGFIDPSHFARCFRRRHGKAPNHCRPKAVNGNH